MSIVIFSCTSLALPTSEGAGVFARQSPILPDDDPFYAPPEGYESAALGTILRSRTPPRPITLSLYPPYTLLHYF